MGLEPVRHDPVRFGSNSFRVSEWISWVWLFSAIVGVNHVPLKASSFLFLKDRQPYNKKSLYIYNLHRDVNSPPNFIVFVDSGICGKCNIILFLTFFKK